jgi:hypothetical protein
MMKSWNFESIKQICCNNPKNILWTKDWQIQSHNKRWIFSSSGQRPAAQHWESNKGWKGPHRRAHRRGRSPGAAGHDGGGTCGGACVWWSAVAHVLVPLHAHSSLEPLGARVGVLRCPGTARPRKRSGPLVSLMVAGAPEADQTVAPPLCVYHGTSMKVGATQEFMIYQKQKCRTVTFDVSALWITLKTALI